VVDPATARTAEGRRTHRRSRRVLMVGVAESTP
jgi:hypothetical protein